MNLVQNLTPYYAIGGGLPAGGTKHAGHANFSSLITPFADLKDFIQPPETSDYGDPMKQKIVMAPSVTWKPAGPGKKELVLIMMPNGAYGLKPKNEMVDEGVYSGGEAPTGPLKILPIIDDNMLASDMPSLVTGTPSPTDSFTRMGNVSSEGVSDGAPTSYESTSASPTDSFAGMGNVSSEGTSSGAPTSYESTEPSMTSKKFGTASVASYKDFERDMLERLTFWQEQGEEVPTFSKEVIIGTTASSSSTTSRRTSVSSIKTPPDNYETEDSYGFNNSWRAAMPEWGPWVAVDVKDKTPPKKGGYYDTIREIRLAEAFDERPDPIITEIEPAMIEMPRQSAEKPKGGAFMSPQQVKEYQQKYRKNMAGVKSFSFLENQNKQNMQKRGYGKEFDTKRLKRQKGPYPKKLDLSQLKQSAGQNIKQKGVRAENKSAPKKFDEFPELKTRGQLAAKSPTRTSKRTKTEKGKAKK